MILAISSQEDLSALVEKLSSLDFSRGQVYEVSYKRRPRKRSVSQNRLYRLWLSCIADETGADTEDLHRIFAGKFIGADIVEVLGEKVRRIRSTASLTTQQFTEFLERVQTFASTELGISLPSPEDRFYSQFEEYYKASLISF